MVNCQLFRQHEVHRVGGHRKHLPVHTHLQVSVEQRTEPGDVDQLCRKQERWTISKQNTEDF